jgi:hypothetical protein
MKLLYDEDTGAITQVGTRLGYDIVLHEFDITTEQLVGATVERQRHGGRPAAIRLADDTIITETWPPPRDLYDDLRTWSEANW